MIVIGERRQEKEKDRYLFCVDRECRGALRRSLLPFVLFFYSGPSPLIRTIPHVVAWSSQQS